MIPIPMLTPGGKAADPLFAAVVALLSMNGPNGGTVITNTAERGLLFDPNSSVAISTTKSLYGGSSLHFNGSAQNYAFSRRGDCYSMGSGEYTIEGYVNFDTVSGTQFIYDNRPIQAPGVTGGPLIALIGTQWNVFVDGGFFIFGGTAAINTWYYIAVSKVGNVVRFFVDGVQVGGDHVTSQVFPANAGIVFGAPSDNPSILNLNGYLQEWRVTKGFGRYASNFTPPNQPFPVVDTPDALFSQVPLLLQIKNNALIEQAGKGAIVTTNGGGSIVTNQSIYDLHSFYNPAINANRANYLGIAAPVGSPNQFIFPGDFTFEIYTQLDNAVASFTSFFGSNITSPNVGFWAIQCGVTGGIIYFVAPSGVVQSGGSAVPGLWHSLVFVRQGSDFGAFFDGTSIFSGSYALQLGILEGGISKMTVYGGAGPGDNSDFKGWLSNFRVTNGSARYNPLATFITPYLPPFNT